MEAVQRGPGIAPESGSDYEVVVVGAGQAGLAMGYFLKQQGRKFVIVEAADSIGSAWRDRWESLTLFTPRRYSGLPGLPFPGDPEGYPDRDEVIAYLERYAETFELPSELNSPVRKLTAENGRFVLEGEGRTTTADQVVVATGPFQKPYVPEVAKRLAPDVVQMHSTGYRNPGDIPEGTVLVVGGGNTGFQIAEELSRTHGVVLAVGSKQKPLPQRLLGRGYRPDYAWIDLPVFEGDGRQRHRRGVTDAPGLYFLGLTWQHTRGSALIGWVKDDAAFIAEQIKAFQETKSRPTETRVEQRERV
jgi:cation diffusion facilitator CzcD-associated flavoprotein CzcO